MSLIEKPAKKIQIASQDAVLDHLSKTGALDMANPYPEVFRSFANLIAGTEQTAENMANLWGFCIDSVFRDSPIRMSFARKNIAFGSIVEAITKDKEFAEEAKRAHEIALAQRE